MDISSVTLFMSRLVLWKTSYWVFRDYFQTRIKKEMHLIAKLLSICQALYIIKWIGWTFSQLECIITSTSVPMFLLFYFDLLEIKIHFCTCARGIFWSALNISDPFHD